METAEQHWLERQLVIANALGLHCRAAMKMMAVASPFAATVELVRDDGRVADCKSVLDLMALGCPQGTPVRIRACGADAAAALTAVAEVICRKFDEE